MKSLADILSALDADEKRIIREAIDDSYREGWKDGYDLGSEDGEEKGYEEGYRFAKESL